MEYQTEENNLDPQKQLLGMLRVIKKPCNIRLEKLGRIVGISQDETREILAKMEVEGLKLSFNNKVVVIEELNSCKKDDEFNTLLPKVHYHQDYGHLVDIPTFAQVIGVERSAIHKHLERHADELQEGYHWVSTDLLQLATVAPNVDRVLTKHGIIRLCFLSNPKKQSGLEIGQNMYYIRCWKLEDITYWQMVYLLLFNCPKVL